MQEQTPIRTKVFVHITQNWTPRAFFAAYEYADEAEKDQLSVFDHNWKFINEIQHRIPIPTENKSWRIKTIGLEIDGTFVSESQCKETLNSLNQMMSYSENFDWYFRDDDATNFVQKSFLYYMNDGISQLPLQEMRKHFLNLQTYPGTNEPILVDDCLIVCEVDTRDGEKSDRFELKATFWFLGKGDPTESITDALIDSDFNLMHISVASGYGFLTIESNDFIDHNVLVTVLNEKMSLFKIVKIVPM